jgi:hypothetical protein
VRNKGATVREVSLLRFHVLPLSALCALSIGLLFVRWQASPPGPVRLDLGSPGSQASHFYGVERSDGVSFRWSRSLSAVSLPALASSQLITFKANPARPVGAANPHVRLSVGTRTVGEFDLQPGWQVYTATTGPGVAPDLRLLVESDTFYPGASDRRRLGVAISEFSAAAAPSRLGLFWPPLLWLVVGFLSPLLGHLTGRLLGTRGAALLGAGAAFLPAIVSLAMPAGLALPVAAWITLLAALIVLPVYAPRAVDVAPSVRARLGRLVSSRWELPAIGLGTALLAVVMTWPLASRIGESLPGWPGDNFAFLYKFWWFRTALLAGRWPMFDPNTFAPFGFDLGQGEPTLANTLPGVLLGALFNDVAAYNLLALTSFVVSGLGAYLLVREVTGSRAAGLLGAVVFAFCPYRMSQFAGHIQLLGTGWIALAFYFVERAFKTSGWVHGALAGVSLALAALSAWYYAYMVGLVLALYLLMRIWTARRTLRLGRMLGAGVAAGLAFAALAGPVALPSLMLWGQGRLSHTAKAADEHSAAPLDYMLPSELHPVWGEPFMRAHAEQNVIESLLYLGAVPVGIALLGWAVGRRGGKGGFAGPPVYDGLAAPWLWVVSVSLVLSFGLTLHDLGGQVRLSLGSGTAEVPLPGRLLYDWLPLFSSMRAYARFGLLVTLGLVVLMGIAWTYIAARWPGRSNRLAALALLLLLADLWTAPYAWGTSRVQPPPVATLIAGVPAGTVMQMPLTSALSGPALYRARYYGKPVAYGYDTFEPAPWRAARPALASFPEDQALDVLESWGVRYVVVSANAYGADWEGTEQFLKSLPRLRHLGDYQGPRTWDVDPSVLDARPDMEDYVLPDTLAVFELVR